MPDMVLAGAASPAARMVSRAEGPISTRRRQVTFEEAAFGGSKVIHFQGGGRTQSLEIKIPAGIESGKTLRLAGKGMPGRKGGPAGDLLLKIRVQEKPGYRREGSSLYTTVQIPFTTAVFGGEVRIPHDLRGCDVQDQGRDTVRHENPPEGKRDRVHGTSGCARRPVHHGGDCGYRRN